MLAADAADAAICANSLGSQEASETAQDAEITALWSQLQLHPHREAGGIDRAELKEVLARHLKLAEENARRAFYRQRGFSPYEALPDELVTKIVNLVHEQPAYSRKTELTKLASVSHSTRRAVHSIVFRELDLIQSGTIQSGMKRDTSSLLHLGPYIRRLHLVIGVQSRRDDSYRLLTKVSRLESLRLLVQCLDRWKICMQDIDKRVQDVVCLVLERHANATALHGADFKAPRLQHNCSHLHKLVVKDVLADASFWKAFVSMWSTVKTLEELEIDGCRDTPFASIFGATKLSDDLPRPRERLNSLRRFTAKGVAAHGSLGVRLLAQLGSNVEVIELDELCCERARDKARFAELYKEWMSAKFINLPKLKKLSIVRSVGTEACLLLRLFPWSTLQELHLVDGSGQGVLSGAVGLPDFVEAYLRRLPSDVPRSVFLGDYRSYCLDKSCNYLDVCTLLDELTVRVKDSSKHSLCLVSSDGKGQDWYGARRSQLAGEGRS